MYVPDRLPPIAITLLLRIYCVAEPIRKSPAHAKWLWQFEKWGWIAHSCTCPSSWEVTVEGSLVVEEICRAPGNGYKRCLEKKKGSLDFFYAN